MADTVGDPVFVAAWQRRTRTPVPNMRDPEEVIRDVVDRPRQLKHRSDVRETASERHPDVNRPGRQEYEDCATARVRHPVSNVVARHSHATGCTPDLWVCDDPQQIDPWNDAIQNLQTPVRLFCMMWPD